MEDAARATERDRRHEERAADGDEPSGAGIVAAQPGPDKHHQRRRPGRSPGASPPDRPAPAFSSRSGPASPPKTTDPPPGPPPPVPPAARRAAVLPEQATEAVVAEDQRPDAVVVGARDPRAVGGRRQPHEYGPGETDGGHRGATDRQLASGDRPAARSDPHPGGDDARHDHERCRHLRLEAEPDGHARPHEPAGTSVLEPADEEPQRRDGAQHQQRVGVVVPRDRDGDRRGRQSEATRESGCTTEAAADEVLGQHDAADAHQRLRREQAPRREAEHPRRRAPGPTGPAAACRPS